MYLDSGYETAEKFINKYLLSKLPEIIKTGAYKDAKSKFQEEAQEKEGITPVYKVIEESGPDHKKKFIIGVFLGKEEAARGSGSSKQEAEEEAAKSALQIKNWNKN